LFVVHPVSTAVNPGKVFERVVDTSWDSYFAPRSIERCSGAPSLGSRERTFRIDCDYDSAD